MALICQVLTFSDHHVRVRDHVHDDRGFRDRVSSGHRGVREIHGTSDGHRVRPYASHHGDRVFRENGVRDVRVHVCPNGHRVCHGGEIRGVRREKSGLTCDHVPCPMTTSFRSRLPCCDPSAYDHHAWRDEIHGVLYHDDRDVPREKSDRALNDVLYRDGHENRDVLTTCVHGEHHVCRAYPNGHDDLCRPSETSGDGRVRGQRQRCPSRSPH